MRYGLERSVKLYYTISEVSKMTGLAQHVLRYWENEFPMLRPRKNRAGNRSYREKDIEIIRRIQQLLHVEKFTVEGAVLRLKEDPPLINDAPSSHVQPASEKVTEQQKPPLDRQTGKLMLGELRKIRELLNGV